MAKAKDIPAAETLEDRLRALPRGTKESQAYAALGDGISRETFRDAWLKVRVPKVEQGKA